MSDERTSPQSAVPVHFDHYCDCPGCVKWGAFGKERATGSPNGAARSTWPLTIGTGDTTRETERPSSNEQMRPSLSSSATGGHDDNPGAEQVRPHASWEFGQARSPLPVASA